MERFAPGTYTTRNISSIQTSHSSKVAEEVLVEKGLYDTVMFSNSGPAGAFGLYVAADAYLPRVLLNEFVTVTTEIRSGYIIRLTIIL
jgi:hypothetical protein